MPDTLQFGLTLPLAAEDALAHAAMAEVLGYDSLWVSEHVLFHVPTFDAVTTIAPADFAKQIQHLAIEVVPELQMPA